MRASAWLGVTSMMVNGCGGIVAAGFDDAALPTPTEDAAAPTETTADADTGVIDATSTAEASSVGATTSATWAWSLSCAGAFDSLTWTRSYPCAEGTCEQRLDVGGAGETWRDGTGRDYATWDSGDEFRKFADVVVCGGLPRHLESGALVCSGAPVGTESIELRVGIGGTLYDWTPPRHAPIAVAGCHEPELDAVRAEMVALIANAFPTAAPPRF
jgi:hypothetical protein